METHPNQLDRIFAAADQLYEASGKQAFPTVDEVRKQAAVNMADACAGMRAWRRSKKDGVAPMPVQIPATLQDANMVALQALWTQATSIANATLAAAQTAWEIERSDAAELNDQMATAFEAQANEMAAQAAELNVLRQELEKVRIRTESTQQRCEQLVQEKAALSQARDQGIALLAETEKRANDLARELERTHTALATALKDAQVDRAAAATEHAALRCELADLRLNDAARQAELGAAREEAASLRGALAVKRKYRSTGGNSTKSATAATGGPT